MSAAGEPFVRPGMLVSAALVVGGGVAAIGPQHALTIVQLVVAALAVIAALHVLQVNVTDLRGRRSRGSPLDYAVVRREAPAELQITRARLSRDRVAGGSVPLPHATARQLARAVATELERRGFDLTDAAQRASARALVAPTTWAVLTEDRRPADGERRSYLPADGPRVADVVHTVLDDLDRLATRTQGEPTEDSPTPGAP